MTDLATLAALMDLCRAKGVRSLALGEFALELGPPAPAEESRAKPGPDEDRCRCGHSLSVAHNDAGLCLAGCTVEECAPEETS